MDAEKRAQTERLFTGIASTPAVDLCPYGIDMARDDGKIVPNATVLLISSEHRALLLEALTALMYNQWTSLKDNPPPPELKSFWVGHSKGGRISFVSTWPDDNGEQAFWMVEPYRLLTSYEPDVWHPGPARTYSRQRHQGDSDQKGTKS